MGLYQHDVPTRTRKERAAWLPGTVSAVDGAGVERKPVLEEQLVREGEGKEVETERERDVGMCRLCVTCLSTTGQTHIPARSPCA